MKPFKTLILALMISVPSTVVFAVGEEVIMAHIDATLQAFFPESIMQAIQTTASLTTMVEQGIRMYETTEAQLRNMQAQYEAFTESMQNFDAADFEKFRKSVNNSAGYFQDLVSTVDNLAAPTFGGVTIDFTDLPGTQKAVFQQWEKEQEANDNWQGLTKFGFNGAVVKTLQQAQNTAPILTAAALNTALFIKGGLANIDKELNRINAMADDDPSASQLSQIGNDLLTEIAKVSRLNAEASTTMIAMGVNERVSAKQRADSQMLEAIAAAAIKSNDPDFLIALAEMEKVNTSELGLIRKMPNLDNFGALSPPPPEVEKPTSIFDANQPSNP